MTEVSDGLGARRAALAAIKVVEEDKAWSTIAVPDAVGDLREARDRAFASRLAYDTIRWEGTLDWALGHASSRPPRDIEPSILRVLRMGALQLMKMRVPSHSVVDTAATLAKESVPRARAQGAAGFVNGVLRGLNRKLQSDALQWPDDGTVEGLVLATAHPEWIVRDAMARFGDDVRAVLDADNESPGLTLRANGSVTELVAELRALGIDAHPHDAVGVGVSAPGGDPRRLACVQEGRAVPQDAASMLVVESLEPQPGQAVLDLCAGPGGKTSHLATLVGPTGSVTAVELHPHRARLVTQAAARQGLDVDVVIGDVLEDPVGDRTFDAVLLDAPCTGLGVGRRRPEVRWRREPKDAAALGELQARMLVEAARHVAPGGKLTYAVCTWTTAETLGVLADPEVKAATAGLGELTLRQVRPDVDDADGMFIATWDGRQG